MPAAIFMMKRQYIVAIHRWVGLFMAVFLIIEGLTGSLLAFNQELEALINPVFFATAPAADAHQLDLASIAERAEQQEPQIRVGYF